MTPRPAEGAISWNMNTTCNYRCTYCTQRFKDDRGKWARDVDRFIAFFLALEGRWEVKLSGGEPFVHPRLDEVASGIARGGHALSVVTNFSAERATLASFVAAAGSALRIFSCSLHLEYAPDLEAWLDKVSWFSSILPGWARLHVHSVATRAFLPRLAAIRAAHEARGIVFKVQPEKQEGRVIDYDDAERDELLSLGGHNLTGEVAPSFLGLPCWAGARYFALDEDGNAYRCYPARRRKKERLGNVLDGTFRLRDEARPCPYDYCNCTVPIERGMMPRVREEAT